LETNANPNLLLTNNSCTQEFYRIHIAFSSGANKKKNIQKQIKQTPTTKWTVSFYFLYIFIIKNDFDEKLKTIFPLWPIYFKRIFSLEFHFDDYIDAHRKNYPKMKWNSMRTFVFFVYIINVYCFCIASYKL